MGYFRNLIKRITESEWYVLHIFYRLPWNRGKVKDMRWIGPDEKEYKIHWAPSNSQKTAYFEEKFRTTQPNEDGVYVIETGLAGKYTVKPTHLDKTEEMKEYLRNRNAKAGPPIP